MANIPAQCEYCCGPHNLVECQVNRKSCFYFFFALLAEYCNVWLSFGVILKFSIEDVRYTSRVLYRCDNRDLVLYISLCYWCLIHWFVKYLARNANSVSLNVF